MSGSAGSGAARKFLTKMARRKFVIISQENSGVFSKILNVCMYVYDYLNWITLYNFENWYK